MLNYMKLLLDGNSSETLWKKDSFLSVDKSLLEPGLSMSEKKMVFGQSWPGFRSWQSLTKKQKLESLLASNRFAKTFGKIMAAIIIAAMIMRTAKNSRQNLYGVNLRISFDIR